MQDKGFQPACLFQWLDLIADMTDEIEIEVLFACSTLIKKINDVFLGRHPVIGEDTAVCVGVSLKVFSLL